MAERGAGTIQMQEVLMEGATFADAADRFTKERKLVKGSLNFRGLPDGFFDSAEIVCAKFGNNGEADSWIGVANEGYTWTVFRDGEQIFSDDRSKGIQILTPANGLSRVLAVSTDVYETDSKSVHIIEGSRVEYSKHSLSDFKVHNKFSDPDYKKVVLSGNSGSRSTIIAVVEKDEEGEGEYWENTELSVEVGEHLKDVNILAIDEENERLIWTGRQDMRGKERGVVMQGDRLLLEGELLAGDSFGGGKNAVAIARVTERKGGVLRKVEEVKTKIVCNGDVFDVPPMEEFNEIIANEDLSFSVAKFSSVTSIRLVALKPGVEPAWSKTYKSMEALSVEDGKIRAKVVDWRGRAMDLQIS